MNNFFNSFKDRTIVAYAYKTAALIEIYKIHLLSLNLSDESWKG